MVATDCNPSSDQFSPSLNIDLMDLILDRRALLTDPDLVDLLVVAPRAGGHRERGP